MNFIEFMFWGGTFFGVTHIPIAVKNQNLLQVLINKAQKQFIILKTQYAIINGR